LAFCLAPRAFISFMIYRIGRATRTIIIGSVLFAALALTVMRLLLPEVEAYRAELEDKVGEVLGAPVKIGSLRAHISGFRPELILADIQVSADTGSSPAIQLKEIRVGVDLLESLWSRGFLSALRVSLVGAKLGIVRKADGSLAVTGLKSGGEPPLWLLQGRHYEMLQSEVVWRNEINGNTPLTFSDVDIAIENNPGENRRRLHVLLALPEELGQSLRLSMDAAGNIFAPGGINGRLYAEGKGISLAALSGGRLPEGLQVVAGTADFKLWSEWDKSRLTALLGDVSAAQGKLHNAAKETLNIETFAAKFRWRRAADYWQLQVKDVYLASGEMLWNGDAFNVRAFVNGEDAIVEKAAAFIPRLNISAISRLALFSGQLNAVLERILRQLKPSGTLQNLALFIEPERQRYAFSGGFSDLGWSSLDGLPAVKQLSGSVKGSEQGGEVQLATQAGQIEFPGLFRAAIPVSRLAGNLRWRQTPQQWQISSAMLEVDAPDIETKSRLLLQIPKGAEPVFMDLQTAFKNGKDVTQAKKYFPVGIMDAEVVAWLDRAFVAGEVIEGGGLLRGNLKDFPFTGHQGVFEVLFAARGLELKVHPEWPNIKGIDAEVQFLQGALQAGISSGETEGLQIGQAAGSIASLGDSVHLLLKGNVSGSVQQGLNYLQKTPLRDTVNPVLEFIAAQGASDADLDLQIPLTETATAKVNGAVHLRNAELTVLPLNVQVGAIKGDLKFNERGLYAQGIKAQALGDKVAADIIQSGGQPPRLSPPGASYRGPRSTAIGAGQTVLRLDGRVAVKNLAEAFPNQHWSAAQGQADYRLRLGFPGTGEQPASLELTSDLQGLALDWPGTLKKTARQTRLLRARFGFPEGALLPVTINYGDELLAALYIDKQNKSLFSGDILLTQGSTPLDAKHDTGQWAAIGAEQAKLSMQPGLTVGVKRPDFDIDPWLNAVSQNGDAGGPANLPRSVTIETQHLRWQNNDLGPLTLQLQLLDGRWQGALKSGFAKGNISAPVHFAHTEKLVLDMQTLNLSSLEALQLQGDALSPLDMPELQINSRRLLWKSVNLGEMNLRAVAVANGLDFSTVEVRGEDGYLNLTGHWQTSGKQSFSEAKGALRSEAWGKLLARLDIFQDMQDTPGQIDFTLHWAGAPYQASFAGLQGIADADLGEGRLLGVNPGVGRVLGILALDQWKRRLQLDFSDAYAEGLTYNRIKGHFELAGGYAFTDNLTIEAVPAKIEVKGKTGLAARDWDQLVIVSPKTSAALPIAGTIAGKLITGAASLVADEAFVEELKHISSAAYQVKGKWGAAEITPLPESDGLLRKVWTGMTDFSWLK
jgi:uncharacterized protein (TIGR02099 family)